MAMQHGRAGVVHISSVAVAHVTAWSYSEAVEEVDVTAMGDSAKSYQGGLRDGTVNIECFWDAADAGQEDITDGLAAGTAITVNLYTDGTTDAGSPYYTGSITITSQEISSGVDSMITAKFTGRGFLAYGTVSA
jgi:hypothetical protein